MRQWFHGVSAAIVAIACLMAGTASAQSAFTLSSKTFNLDEGDLDQLTMTLTSVPNRPASFPVFNVVPVISNTAALGINPSGGYWTKTKYDNNDRSLDFSLSAKNRAGANDTVSVTISWRDDVGALPASNNVTVTITDPQVLVEPRSAAVVRSKSVDFRLRMNAQPDGNIPVNVVPAAGASVSPTSLTFTSSNWNTTQVVAVTGTAEGTHDVEFRTVGQQLQDGRAGLVDSNTFTASVEVVDPMVEVTPPSPAEIVTDRTVSWEVRLNNAPTGPVTVTNSVDSGGTVSPASLTFTAGSTAGQMVTATATGGVGGTISVTSEVIAQANANASSASVDLTIVRPEVVLSRNRLDIVAGGFQTYTVRLDRSPSNAGVTVTPVSGLTTAATVSGALTFTTDNWNAPQTVTVTGVDESASVRIRNVTSLPRGPSPIVTVAVGYVDFRLSRDSLDVVRDGTATYTVVLDREPGGSVTIAASSADASMASVYPRSLTFGTSNWSVAQTFTVTGADRTDSPVRIENRTQFSRQAAKTVMATVAYPDIVLSRSDVTVIKNRGQSYGVRLDREPAGEVTVAVTSSNAGAATVNPTVLTFTRGNWSTMQAVEILGVDKSARPVVITNRTNFNQPPIVLTANAIDPAFGISSTFLRIAEGQTATYAVALDTKPTDEVIVSVASDNADIAVAHPGTLFFNTRDWNTAQTVTVRARENVGPGSAEVANAIQQRAGNYNARLISVSVRVFPGASGLAKPARESVRTSLRSRLTRMSDLVARRIAIRQGGGEESSQLRIDNETGLVELNRGSRFGLSTWSSAQYSRIKGSVHGMQSDIYLGIDFATAGEGGIYGLMFGYQKPKLRIDGARVNSTVRSGGLYGSARYRGLVLGGSVSVGKGKSHAFAGDARARSVSRYHSASGEVTGTARFVGQLSVQPQVGATYAREKLDAFTDSNEGVSNEDRLAYYQVGLGPRIGFDHAYGSAGMTIRANWNYFDWTSRSRSHVFSGNVHFDTLWRLDDASSLAVNAGMSGIGTGRLSDVSTIGLQFGRTF